MFDDSKWHDDANRVALGQVYSEHGIGGIVLVIEVVRLEQREFAARSLSLTTSEKRR